MIMADEVPGTSVQPIHNTLADWFQGVFSAGGGTILPKAFSLIPDTLVGTQVPVFDFIRNVKSLAPRAS